MTVGDTGIMKTPTVLVLGAGASRPFGLPLGRELKQGMLNQLGDGQTRSLLESLEFDGQLIDAFRDALRYGTHPTIDVFLEKKTSFRELGSYLIAKTLMPLERDNQLFPQRDWYGDLFVAMNFETEEPDVSLLSVVTLNYDRSFEHFLKMNIVYNCHEEQVGSAHTKRESIKVVHAHGSLGPYPEVPYGTKATDADSLRRAAESIKIVSDRLDKSPDFQKAQQIVADAYHVVFLGFGYNEITLTALLAETALDGKHFYGTGFNLDEPTKNKLQNIFGDKMTLGEGLDCSKFLKHIRLTSTEA